MSAALPLFLRDCRQYRRVSLVGPLLDTPPDWPNNPIVFVDGGARWRPRLPTGFARPCLSVGDGDSLGSERLDVLLDVDKDCSDLAFALDLLAELSPDLVALHGFLGGRRDHEWINFGVAANFLRRGRQQRVDFDRAVSLFAPGDYRLHYNGTFSLAHLQPSVTTLRGRVRYPLEEPTALEAGSSHGLSNRASGSFQLTSDGVSICFWC